MSEHAPAVEAPSSAGMPAHSLRASSPPRMALPRDASDDQVLPATPATAAPSSPAAREHGETCPPLVAQSDVAAESATCATRASHADHKSPARSTPESEKMNQHLPTFPAEVESKLSPSSAGMKSGVSDVLSNNGDVQKQENGVAEGRARVVEDTPTRPHPVSTLGISVQSGQESQPLETKNDTEPSSGAPKVQQDVVQEPGAPEGKHGNAQAPIEPAVKDQRTTKLDTGDSPKTASEEALRSVDFATDRTEPVTFKASTADELCNEGTKDSGAAVAVDSVQHVQPEGPGVTNGNEDEERKDVVMSTREKRPLPNRPLSEPEPPATIDPEGSDSKRRRIGVDNTALSEVESGEPASTASMPAPNTAGLQTVQPPNSSTEAPIEDLTLQSQASQESQAPIRSSASVSPVSSAPPMLRSTPVTGKSAAAPGGQQHTDLARDGDSIMGVPNDNFRVDDEDSEAASDAKDDDRGDVEQGEAAPVEPKKRRSVSWAPAETLVEVQYINARLELVRSWDPESHITLPFAPLTLEMFRNMSTEQERAEMGTGSTMGKNGQADKSTEQSKKISFEAARKKEHDMELERAQKARETLQKKLDGMSPARAWGRPVAIVLPTECRFDPDACDKYSLVDDNYKRDSRRRRPDETTPPSPTPLMRAASGHQRVDADVPIIKISEATSQSDDRHYDNDTTHEAAIQLDGVADNAGHVQHGKDMLRSQMPTNRGQIGDGCGPQTASSGRAPPSHSLADAYSGEMDGNSQTPSQEEMQRFLSAVQEAGLLPDFANQSQSQQQNGAYGNMPSRQRAEGLGNEGWDHQASIRGGRGGMDGQNVNGRAYTSDPGRGQGRGPNMMGYSSDMHPSNGGMGPPPNSQMPPPPQMMGHPGQGPHSFPAGGQQPGLMDGYGYPMPPIPPMGLPPPNMMPMGMGLPVPPMGVPMPFNMPQNQAPMNGPSQLGNTNKSSKAHLGSGRPVETITRPKLKSKQRKRCKYFGTKQGCRDGNACIFAHN